MKIISIKPNLLSWYCNHIISLKFFPKAFEKGKILDSYYFAVGEMDPAAEGIRYFFPGE